MREYLVSKPGCRVHVARAGSEISINVSLGGRLYLFPRQNRGIYWCRMSMM